MGRVKGRVLVNGEPQQGAAFIARTSYMERGEQYYPYLTVEESMLYRAALLMPRTTTLRARRKFVEEVRSLRACPSPPLPLVHQGRRGTSASFSSFLLRML